MWVKIEFERLMNLVCEVEEKEAEEALLLDLIDEDSRTISSLKEDRDMLAAENKNMARHLLDNDYSAEGVESICNGFDNWRDEDPNEPTPSQMNEELRSGGW